MRSTGETPALLQDPNYVLYMFSTSICPAGFIRGSRLTAFSKKVENHAYAVALHMMYYNFVRIHKSLRVTPAMAAGVADKLWEIGDIVALIEKAESRLPTKRGPYKKRAA